MLDEEKSKAQLISELNYYRRIAVKLETVGLAGETDWKTAGGNKSFQSIIEGLDAAVFIIYNNRIKYINQAGGALFGKSVTQLYTPLFWELIHPAFQSLVKNEIERIRGDHLKSLKEDIKLVHPERGGVWINANLSSIQLEGQLHILGLAFDITGRKQNENITSILFRISNAISTTHNLGDLFQTIHQVLKDVIAAPNFFLSLISDGRIHLDFPFYINKTVFNRPLITNIQEPVGLALNAAVLNRRVPLFYQKRDLVELVRKGEMSVTGQLPEVWLGVPLKIRGKTIGALCVEHHKDPFFYRKQDIDLLSALSEQVAFAIERKTTQEILRSLATTDSLTGLFNRRYFMELAQRELERTKRYGHGLSILLINVDHFKSVNDRFGHTVGDQVLVNFSKLMKENLREVDVMGRLGGEEFAVLMPMTRTATALEVAERLRYTIEREEVAAGRTPVKITISGGVAAYRKGIKYIGELIRKADRGLYAAKKNGRNRIEMIDAYTEKKENT